MDDGEQNMPGKDRDEESGQYTDTYSAEAMVEAIRELGRFAGTSDVAEEVGCARDTAYKKLKKLQDENRVESRKVGGALVWHVVEGDE